MADDVYSFGAWVRLRRQALVLSREDMAHQVGVAEVSIRKIEADERRPSPQVAALLAQQLQLAPETQAIFVQAARGLLTVDQLPPPIPGARGSAIVAPAVPTSAPVPTLPSGTVTFLFTDIEGSTTLWEQHAATMERALSRHDQILRQAIDAYSGVVFKTVGDAFYAVFTTAADALDAILSAQRALRAESWGSIGAMRVRSALHVGATQQRAGDYFGMPLNRIARLLAAGHGGQILLSNAAQELVRDALPKGTALRDLGEHRLKDLSRREHIFQLVAPDLPADFPPLRSLDSYTHNLPAQPNALIGREAEVLAVGELVRRGKVRLVTLTGPGGIGKTRLALQAAAEALHDFTDGVYVVNLAPISDPALVVATVAQTLGVKESGSRPLLERLTDELREKALLLLLDNFEQVLEAAPQLAELLATCPKLKILVTSRVVLHLYGEHEFGVPPLSLPDRHRLPPLDRLTQYEAVRLFIERAQAAKADFVVTNASAPAVAEICYRLDGLPLAIELAAARSKLFSPQALLSRLSHRLNLLTGGGRDLPARHQTIRGAIDWSYNLLDTAEQMLFARLGVFVGGCTLEAAETVLADEEADDEDDLSAYIPRSIVLDGLASLIDKSLLKQQEPLRGEIGGEPRLTMLETIREYAREKLDQSGETERLRQRHRDYFIAFAEQAEPKLKGAEQLEWLDRLEVEYDNLRAAWNCAIESDTERALRLASAFLEFWSMRGNPGEGRQWLAQLIGRTDQSGKTAQRAQVLRVAGQLAYSHHDFVASRQLFEQALDIARSAGDKKEIASALLWAAWSELRQRDAQIAWSFSQEALTIYQELQDQWGIAMAYYHLADAAMAQGHYGEAEEFLIKGLGIYRELGDNYQAGHVLNVLGEVARLQGDYERAGTFYEEAIEILKAQRSVRLLIPLLNLAWVALHQGDYHSARGLFQESLSLCKKDDDTPGMILCLAGLAGVLGMTGNLEQAARLFGAVDSLYEPVGGGERMEQADQKEVDHYVAAVRAKLDDAAFTKAWAAGGAMTLEQAIAEALGGGG